MTAFKGSMFKDSKIVATQCFALMFNVESLRATTAQ